MPGTLQTVTDNIISSLPKISLAVAMILSVPAHSAEQAVTTTDGKEEVTTYTHSGKPYPPVLFVTNIKAVPIKDKLNAYHAFSRLDTEEIGLPIGIRILKGYHTRQDGTKFSSGLLSASTLGLLPTVSNVEFKVRYDIFVQGSSIATFKYQTESTDVGTIWTDKPGREHKTTPAEARFIEQTLPRFLNELKNSPEAQDLFKEYRDYFGDLSTSK